MGLIDVTAEQFEGAAFLSARPVAMLADKMGIGKTAQIVLACDLVGARRVLAISPPNLRTNTTAQFALWGMFPRPVQVLRTGDDELIPEGVIACSYNLAYSAKMLPKLRAWRPDVVCLDEAHKVDGGGAVTMAILSPNGVGAVARHVWFATGTPNPNHAGEWFPFAKYCGAWRSTHAEFVAKFCKTAPVFRNGVPIDTKIVGSKNAPELRAMLAPYVLAREKTDTFSVEVEEDIFYCEGRLPALDDIDPEERELIAAAIECQDFEILSQMNPEIVTTARRLVGLAKADSVAALVAADLEADPTARAIVFCDYTGTIDAISRALSQKFKTLVLDGRTAAKAKEFALTCFDPAFPETDVRALVCHQRSAGEGRTMTRANIVCLAEPSWTEDDNRQMIARAARRGQTRRVIARRCKLAGSMDAAVFRTNDRKARDTGALQVGVTKQI